MTTTPEAAAAPAAPVDDALLSAAAASSDSDNDDTRVLIALLREDDEAEGDEALARPVVTSYETDASCKSSGTDSSLSPVHATTETSTVTAAQQEELDEQQRLRAIRLGKRQRQRQRQRDELKYLGFHVQELENELARLRKHHAEFSQQTLAAARRLALLPAGDAMVTTTQQQPPPGVWRHAAGYEREALQTSIMENTRLRAQYECQLQIANGLKRLYENQGHFAVRRCRKEGCCCYSTGELMVTAVMCMVQMLDASPDIGFLPKRPRTATAIAETSDDAAIFDMISRGLDAQFAQTGAVLEKAQLSGYDGELTDEMILRKDEHGTLYFDNLYSKVFPFDVHAISQVLWQTLTVEKLQSFHSQYLVLKSTNDEAHTKVINRIALPHDTEATLVVRIATKRFFEENRSVSVWGGIIEARGAVNLRLRETGWNAIRPAHSLRPGQKGPVSIEQAVVRITPELQNADMEDKLAVGTLMNLLIAAYHRHMEMVHLVADDLLAMEFENISLGD